MRRTEALQGVRMAMFLNILSRWESAELNQDEAAELLGVSERTFRRWTRRYEEEGEAGLVDRRLGKASGKRVPVDRAAEVERLYRERYQGFTVKHFHEHLVKDHGFGWGYTWTKLHLQWMGVVGKAPRKGAHRRKRERRPLPGMMLHQDGSRHAWLEGQGQLDLIVTMDDATGTIYSAFLVEEEGTASTFRALREVFGKHGLPMSLYTERGAHYFHTPKAGGEIDRGHPTQVGRALEQLGVEHIGAYSPQARGRSERMFGTLQDRLVNELRLAGITDIEAANAFLRDLYLPAHTPGSRFCRPAKARRSPPFRASTSTRSCASRRSGRSATTIASPTASSSCRSRQARCGPISSRRGSRSTSTPTAPTRSFTDPDASAATTRTERSETRKTPPKSARRRACGRHGQASGLPTPPTGEQKQKKRTYVVLPKPDNLIRYRGSGRISLSRMRYQKRLAIQLDVIDPFSAR
jgi:transposase